MNELEQLNRILAGFLFLDEARIRSLELSSFLTKIALTLTIGWEDQNSVLVKYPRKQIRIDFLAVQRFELTGDLNEAVFRFPDEAGSGLAEISSGRFIGYESRGVKGLSFEAQWETKRSIRIDCAEALITDIPFPAENDD